MTVSSVELSGSRSGTDATDRSSTAELKWRVWGSSTLATVKTHMESVVPSTYDGLIYKSLSWDHDGAGVWEFRASYVHPDRSDERSTLDLGDYTFSFDVGGETVTRTVSLDTTSYAKSGETAPDFKGAIGVVKEKGESKVEGVEVGVPSLKFSIRKRMAQASITMDYVRTLKALAFTVNDDTFLGWAAGELLFIGATGQEGTDSDPEITYHFIASDSVSSLTIGDITSIAKAGHEYLWVFFEDIEDATAEMTVKQPKAVYVEQVYGEGDFESLGI